MDHRTDVLRVTTDALDVREHAAAYAEEIVRHSEALAREIEADARVRADRIIAEAGTRAAQVEEQAAEALRHLESTAAGVLAIVERARQVLGQEQPARPGPTGVDLLFDSVEAARPERPPRPDTW